MYEKFPPYPYFISVLKNCPRAAWIYTQLWESRDNECKIFCKNKDIRPLFLISPTLFRNNLMCLIDLGLVSMQQKPGEEFEIELVDFNEEEFDSIEVS